MVEIKHERLDSDDVEGLSNPNEGFPEIKLYSQNRLFYWWPVWLTGYIMAAITYLAGTRVETERMDEFFHPSANLGITFVMVLMIVILFTHFSFRGYRSLGVVAVIVIACLVLALMGWWDNFLHSFDYLSIHMNMGFYLFFSTAIFVLWLYATLIHVRLHYYRVRPGQISEMHLVGEGEMNYDTRGAVLEKFREDIFRHWILGFGAGDLKILTTGAVSTEILIKDVLFVDRRSEQIRKLMAVEPTSIMES